MRRKTPLEIEVAVTGMAFGGKGIAKLNGFTVFVDHAIPGDKALIQITRRKKNYAQARLIEILEASADRVAAPCRYSGLCGGCTWQFLRYDRQLVYKQRHVAESLQHIGALKDVTVHPTHPSPFTFEYRNKMEFTCAERRWLLPEELAHPTAQKDFGLGLHVPGAFHKVIDTRECLLQPCPGNRILDEIRKYIKCSGQPVYRQKTHEGFWRYVVLRNSTATGQWMVNVVTACEEREILSGLAQSLTAEFPEVTSIVNNITARKAGIAVGEVERVIAGEGCIRESIGRYEFQVSANSFFQTNTRGAMRLYETVKEYAMLDGRQTVLDLYSGTGTIPIILSSDCREVIGIEIAESAVANARENCRLNGISNCRFLQGDIQDHLAGLGIRPEVVIIDPPRVGVSKDVLRDVLAMAPQRIVYVSCNPATLARDGALLAGAYEILQVQPIDMFPHTSHIESVARLEKRTSR